MGIPFVDLALQEGALLSSVRERIETLLRAGEFIGGPTVSSFETEFARYCNATCCVGVGNGTDALVLALKALGVGPGHEVVVPVFTFVASVEAVLMVGARPRLLDVDPDTLLMDARDLAALDAPRVRAVLPVHLFGLPCDMPSITEIAQQRSWWVVEDAAQAHGADIGGRKVGSWGHAAAFSFYPTKNLGAAGDAGAVTTTREDLGRTIRSLGNHGRVGHQNYERAGGNSRLDAIQAAVLTEKLPLLDGWNRRRAEIAARYGEKLHGQPGLYLPFVPEGRSHVFHAYTIRVHRRDVLAQRLRERGITTAVYYAPPLHLQPAYAHWGYRKGDFPVAEEAAATALSLPLYPSLSDGAVDEVCSQVKVHLLETVG